MTHELAHTNTIQTMPKPGLGEQLVGAGVTEWQPEPYATEPPTTTMEPVTTHLEPVTSHMEPVTGHMRQVAAEGGRHRSLTYLVDNVQNVVNEYEGLGQQVDWPTARQIAFTRSLENKDYGTAQDFITQAERFKDSAEAKGFSDQLEYARRQNDDYAAPEAKDPFGEGEDKDAYWNGIQDPGRIEDEPTANFGEPPTNFTAGDTEQTRMSDEDVYAHTEEFAAVPKEDLKDVRYVDFTDADRLKLDELFATELAPERSPRFANLRRQLGNIASSTQVRARDLALRGRDLAVRATGPTRALGRDIAYEGSQIAQERALRGRRTSTAGRVASGSAEAVAQGFSDIGYAVRHPLRTYRDGLPPSRADRRRARSV